MADFRTDQEIEIEIAPEVNFDSAKAKKAARSNRSLTSWWLSPSFHSSREPSLAILWESLAYSSWFSLLRTT
jgi:hypothetical protein